MFKPVKSTAKLQTGCSERLALDNSTCRSRTGWVTIRRHNFASDERMMVLVTQTDQPGTPPNSLNMLPEQARELAAALIAAADAGDSGTV